MAGKCLTREAYGLTREVDDPNTSAATDTQLVLWDPETWPTCSVP